MALPGERDRPLTPPQRWRIAIGETYASGDRQLPRKLDYFRICRLSYQQGRAPIYITDEAMQTAMCRAAGVQQKPTAIPVTVIGNPIRTPDGIDLPESILWSRMAYYSGGRAVCSCAHFDASGEGTATRRRYDQAGALLEETHPVCNPRTCGFATGNHTLEKYRGVVLCKPQMVACFGLPWAATVGSVAKFKSTGWHNYYALRNSLLTIAAHTGGWLHDLPLWLVLVWERAANGKLVPAVRVEYRGTVGELRGCALELQRLWLGQEHELRQLGAGLSTDVVVSEEQAAEQQATQVEFYPDTAALPADVAVTEGEYTTEAPVEPPAEPEPPPEPEEEPPVAEPPVSQPRRRRTNNAGGLFAAEEEETA